MYKITIESYQNYDSLFSFKWEVERVKWETFFLSLKNVVLTISAFIKKCNDLYFWITHKIRELLKHTFLSFKCIPSFPSNTYLPFLQIHTFLSFKYIPSFSSNTYLPFLQIHTFLYSDITLILSKSRPSFTSNTFIPFSPIRVVFNLKGLPSFLIWTSQIHTFLIR